MNISTTNKVFSNIVLASGAALVVLVAVMFIPTHAVHAQEYDDGGGFGDSGSMDGGSGGYYDSSGFGDTGSCGSDCGGGYYASSGFGDTGSCGSDCGSYADYTTPSYDYGTSGYSSPVYSTPSYASYMPSSFYSTFPTQSQSQSQSSTNVNVNTNTCSATNSCNTTTQINAPTTVTTNTSGGSTYPVYQPVYVPTYQQNYQPVYQQPIAYNQPAPYVSLTAVPYTGLDLGPWGTAAYWGFLILWCLGAAYLIVVKRVQNKLVGALNGFLFGASRSAQPVAHVAAAVNAPVIKTVAPKTIFSGIDPFIASQINRATA